MRWILCGKNAAAVAALEHIVKSGDDVWAIGVRSDSGTDGWQPSFRAAAHRLGVPFGQPVQINDARWVEKLAAYRADVLLSIQYDRILKQPLFEAVGCPCLNLHYALLPRHRGVAPIAWAILEGDAEAGVTLHHMIEDIDAGDVVAQKAVAIESADAARDVYDKVNRAAVELFVESYPFPAGLIGRRGVQSAREACYHRQGDLDFSAKSTDWGRPASELHRWLRAFIFPPMQYPAARLDGLPVNVTRVGGELGPPVDAEPGTVLRVDGRGAEVATGQGSLWVARCESGDGEAVEPRQGQRFS